MSGAFPGLRPRAVVRLGVHRGAFGEQKLRSRDVAVARRPVQRREASGRLFPGKPVGAAVGFRRRRGRRVRGAVGGRRKWWECGAPPVQPTKER